MSRKMIFEDSQRSLVLDRRQLSFRAEWCLGPAL